MNNPRQNRSKKNNKRKRRNRQSNRRGLQARGQSYNYQVHNGPSFAPQMPREFSVALVYNGQETFSLTTSVHVVIPLVEFLNSLPQYSVELFAIYKYCRITAVTLRVEYYNSGTNPYQIVVGATDYTTADNAPISDIIELPGATRKIVSAKGGIDRGIINKTFNPQQIIGNPSLSKYWFDATQATSSTPIDALEPTAVIRADDFQGAGIQIDGTYMYRLTYHCQFFDLGVGTA